MHLTEGTTYYIRLFKLGQKVFPVGLKAFRVSFCQYAVNFPPLTAKLIYETYTEDLKDQEVINVYDPSAGWGGRILGAMAVKDDRNIHYIGTDPNTDHLIEDGQRTKYEDLAEFYNTRTTRGSNLFPHTHSYEIFRVGSEVIHKHPDFQQYKGLVDFIFTSPPYFSKEKYSDDPEQSCAKFTTYEAWRDGFLWPTLETCVEWLKPNRYLAWNVANIKLGNKILPIEDDSVAILEELGCDYITTLRMTLASAPGANRVDEDGKPRTESFCTVVGQNGKEQFLKYEPVLIFLKH